MYTVHRLNALFLPLPAATFSGLITIRIANEMMIYAYKYSIGSPKHTETHTRPLITGRSSSSSNNNNIQRIMEEMTEADPLQMQTGFTMRMEMMRWGEIHRQLT